MKIVQFIFCIVFIFSLSLKATPLTKPHDELRDSMMNFLKNNEVEKAHSLLELGLQKAKEEDNLLNYFQLITKAGTYWRKSASPEISLNIYNKGIQESLWRQPESDKEKKRLAWLYIHLGKTLADKIGNFQEAKKKYEIGNYYFENEIEDTNYSVVAKYIWRNLGNIYTRLGDFSKAETYIQKFIFQMNIDSNRRGETEGYNDLALLYENWGKTDKAYNSYFDGLKLDNNDLVSKSLLLVNLGSFSLKQDSITQAFKYINQAKVNLDNERSNTEFSPRVIYLLGVVENKLSDIYQAQQNYEKSHAALQNALVYYQEYYGNTQRREFGKVYKQIGGLFYKMRNFDGAIQQYQIALQNVLLDYEPKNKFELPNRTSFYAENTIWEALEGMAEAYQSQFEETNDIRLLENALECYHLINEVIAQLRQSYLYDNSKLFNLEETLEQNEKAILLANQLFELTNNTDYLYQAFTFAERNRSSLLQEALQTTEASMEAGLSVVELEQEKSLKYQISKAQETRFRLVAEGSADSLIQAADQVLLNAKDALRDWVKALEIKHPKYYQLKYDDQMPSLAEYQAMLSSKQLMIEYFIGKEQLFVFAMDQQNLRLHLLPLPENLTQNVLNWRKSIEDYQYPNADRIALMTQYKEGGLELYQDLLQEVLAKHQSATDLLIITSGILDLLPFEALLQQTPMAGTNTNDLPYLIQNYTIGYSYSASLYHSLLQLERKGEGMGGFAPDFTASKSWTALTCSADLLANIDDKWQKELSLGAQATSQRFRALAGKYQLLHLATHAQANAEFGDFSYIVFHNEQGGYDSLFAKDLYLEDIQAELVILSACETALGTLYNSEGVISLARAFHYAGARSVVTTLWSINEGANCHLMESFYKELDKNQNKTTALRNAKIQYLALADQQAAHPVYWAGFQFSGNQREVKGKGAYKWVLFGALGLSLFLGMGFWRKKHVFTQFIG